MFDKGDTGAPGHYNPAQTALLLMDYHAFIVGMVGDVKGPATVEAATKMRSWAKAQGIQVIHALIDPKSTPFENCKGKERLEKIAAAMSGAVDEPAQLTEGGDDATYFRRIGHVSALQSPGLNEYLKGNGIKSLLLMGLSTSGCVLRTATMASEHEYVVTTISDGCADPDDEVHNVLIGKVLNSRGWVATATEFQEGYANRK